MAIQSVNIFNPDQVNPDHQLPEPANIQLITAPLSLIPNQSLFALTANPDIIELPPGIAANYVQGVAALDGDDYIKGSIDPDFVNGNAGQDCMVGNGGNDTLLGGKDFDVIAGSIGDDVLYGNSGDDYMYGNEGNDILRGGQDRDNLVGNLGNDTLTGDRGVDKLWGGEGADVFILQRENSAPPKSIGTPGPRPQNNIDQVLQVEEVTADFILDYNPSEGDIIAITGGLNPQDVILTDRFMVIGDIRDYDPQGPFPLGTIRTADFRFAEVPVTVITEASTSRILGLVRDIPASQIRLTSIA